MDELNTKIENLTSEIEKLKDIIKFIQTKSDICTECSKGSMECEYVHPMEFPAVEYTREYTCPNCNHKINLNTDNRYI